MKQDAPPPKRPPIKRRALERSLDLWLAVWASDPELPESERERVKAEQLRRKTAAPEKVVGILVDQEDVTPFQLKALRGYLSGATAVHHPWTTRRVAGACRSAGAPVTVHRDIKQVVVNSTHIFAAPRGQEIKGQWTPAWEAVRYARHRKLPVTIVLPNGEIE